MKKDMLIVLTAALMFMLSSISSFAQERVDSLCLTVYFPQDVTRLDLSYRDNGLSLDQFVQGVRAVMSDPTCHLQDITIRSGASPEGKFDHNVDLSRGRGRTVKDYLKKQLRLPDASFRVRAVGEDWESLWEKILENDDIPDRDKILDIFERHSDYIHGQPISVIGGPKKELMDLSGGKTWFWLLDNIYPDLRAAGNSVICRFTRDPEPVSGGGQKDKDTVVIIHEHYYYNKDTVLAGAAAGVVTGSGASAGRAVRRQPREKKTSGYRFAVKTNLLFDLAAAPNVELEFPIGKRVSIMAEHTFPWYTFDNDKHAYQLLNSGGEFRLWLGDRTRRSVLTGWYLGLYGAMAEGDFEYEGKGRQFPYTWHAGLTAGWSTPLGKRDNWRLELGLGVGYMPYKYYYYEQNPISGLLIYKYTKEGTWIGPTKLKCTLVWMLPMNKKDKTQISEKNNGGRKK